MGTTGTPAGCWTCKLRHRKCDLDVPICRECGDRCIPCHGYGPKPAWMDGSSAERRELKRVKQAVKANARSVRRARKLGQQTNARQAVSSSTPMAIDDNPTLLPSSPTLSHPPALPSASVTRDDSVPGHADFSEAFDTSFGYPGSSPHSISRPVPRQLASSHAFRPESTFLAMQFLDHVFPWQFPYFRARSRFANRGWLLLLLTNRGLMSQAALALSALHRNVVCLPRRQGCRNDQEALKYHSRALRELCDFSRRAGTEALLGDKFQLADFVASSLTLISFEVFNGAQYDWLPHLDAVTSILGMHSPDVLLGQLPSSSDPNFSPSGSTHGEESEPDFHFLASQAIWFDILSCISTPRVPKIAYKQWLTPSKLNMADLMGCYNWVMIATGDLAHLQMWKNDMKKQNILSMPELVMRGHEIETRLRDGIAELELTIEKEDVNTPQAAWVSRVFALASLILSSTIVSGLWPSLPEIRQTVQETICVLRGWPRNISLRGIVWPIYVVGCVAEMEHHDFLVSLLTDFDESRGAFGNAGTVFEIIKTCWTLQKDPDNDRTDLFWGLGNRVLLI